MMDKSNNSKSGNLDLEFRYSQMYVPTGSQVLALDGSCTVTGYPKHRINWQTVINGQSVTGTLDNVCNTGSKTFAMNINLAPYSLPENTRFNIVGSMVGIDSRGKMTYGKTKFLGVAMVHGQGTGSSTAGGGTGGVAGLDGEPTGTNTGPEEEDPWIPPDICTPGPTQRLIEDLDEAYWVEPNAHIAEWPVTSTITNVYFNNAWELCVEHTKLGQWPVTDAFGDGTAVEGTYFFVSGIGDSYNIVWSYHWYRPNQACKQVSFTNTGRYSGVGGAVTPVTFWTPCSGSWVGVVASTPGRMGAQGPIQERSDIYWFQWP